MSGQLLDQHFPAEGFSGPKCARQDCSFDVVGATKKKTLSKFFRHAVGRLRDVADNVGGREVLHLVADETQQTVVSWRGAVVLTH